MRKNQIAPPKRQPTNEETITPQFPGKTLKKRDVENKRKSRD